MAYKKSIIEVKNVTRCFGEGSAKVTALDDVSLKIKSGEYVIIFGPSGCGKSTLLNCLAGLDKPTKGKIVLRGNDLTKCNNEELAMIRNKKIGMVFQQFNYIKSFNILRNVALPQMLIGVPRRIRLKRAMAILRKFSLSKLAHRVPTEISGGQQQRMAIARALVNNPWIMVIDEPTGSLDSVAASNVMSIISQLNSKSKRTIILVTHNQDYLKYGSTIFYMKDGQITKKEKQKPVIAKIITKKQAEKITGKKKK